ncbi:MAG: hypothetical protein KDK36_11955 [Leptospiraceae bacterium]|nr:hypothetical protein [Leptospiraceae bacterium]
MKRFAISILVVLLSFSSLQAKEVPSAGAMMFDAVAIRPLGVGSILVGSTIFFVALPFSFFAPSPLESLRQTSNRLVIYPVRFTFQRPIGDFPGYMEEIEYVEE